MGSMTKLNFGLYICTGAARGGRRSLSNNRQAQATIRAINKESGDVEYLVFIRHLKRRLFKMDKDCPILSEFQILS
jgi:hypothetical protein